MPPLKAASAFALSAFTAATALSSMARASAAVPDLLPWAEAALAEAMSAAAGMATRSVLRNMDVLLSFPVAAERRPLENGRPV